MSRRQKFRSIMISLLSILCVIVMLAEPYVGYQIVLAILSITLLAYGIKLLVYYFTMACHMVGGKRVLYRGMIIFDLGAFTVTLADIPRLYIMIYLMGSIIFSGAIDVLRALEKKKLGAHYRLKLLQGVGSLAIGVLGLFFANTADYVVYFYSAGMLYSAVIRITEVFRKDVQIVTVAP